MIQSPHKVVTDLKNGKYSNIYFLHGDEPYYIDLITEYVEKNIIDNSEKDFNLTVMYGKDQLLSNILLQAKRFPLDNGKYQVVIVIEAQDLVDLKGDSANKLLESYVKNPQLSTILLFAYKYNFLSEHKKLFKIIESNSIVVNSQKLYDNQIIEWIKNYIKEKSINISDQGIKTLNEFVGNNLTMIANEIDKICINISGRDISQLDIEKYVSINKHFSIFELQGAILQKDHYKTQKIIKVMSLDPKNNPTIVLLVSIFTVFSRLLIVHSTTNISDNILAGILKLNPYFVGEYVKGIKKYSLHKVIKSIHQIHLTDLRLKGIDSSVAKDYEILKELMAKIMLTDDTNCE